MIELPKLSTMVVLYNTNLTLDTTKLLEHLPINDKLIKIQKWGFEKRGESKRDKIKRRSKKEVNSSTGFCNNSITLVMLNDADGQLQQKEITIKIFQNGVFHLTGIIDERQHSTTMRDLLQIIKNTPETLKVIPEKIEIIKYRVVLMNYTTQLVSKNTVAREKLHNDLKALNDPEIRSHYDPDVYPGVKINFGSGKWTVKIFRTGKIILTGIISQDECNELMKILSKMLEKLLPLKLTK